MDAIEAKLAEWAGLYEQLKAARARLKEAGERPPSVDLIEDVADLQRRCGVVLDELNAEYARRAA